MAKLAWAGVIADARKLIRAVWGRSVHGPSIRGEETEHDGPVEQWSTVGILVRPEPDHPYQPGRERSRSSSAPPVAAAGRANATTSNMLLLSMAGASARAAPHGHGVVGCWAPSARAGARRVGGRTGTSAPPAPAMARRLFGDHGRRLRLEPTKSTARARGRHVVVGAQLGLGAREGSSATRRKRGTAVAMAAASDDSGGGELKDIHSKDSTKTLLKSEALYEYMLNTMVYPREHDSLRELRLITQQHTYGYMASPPDSAQFLSMLLKLTGARNTIEVGVFTGYSVLATALAIPADGRVVAIDVSREYFDIGRPVIERAGVAHKVDFREGPASEHLDALLAAAAAGEDAAAFDFAFVDADKGSYGAYHERLLRLVRVGGVLAYDNTLWGGSVALPDDAPLTDADRKVRDHVRAFNAVVAADERVEVVQLPVADGITLCRRIV